MGQDQGHRSPPLRGGFRDGVADYGRSSMKITRPASKAAQRLRQVFHLAHIHITHAGPAFDSALSEQGDGAAGRSAVTLPDSWPDDQVHYSSFVFQSHKRDSLGGS